MVAWHIMFHKNTEKIIYDCVAYMCVCGGKYDLINPCENLINYLHLKVYPIYLWTEWMGAECLNVWKPEYRIIYIYIFALPFYTVCTKRAIKMRNEWGREFNRENIDILNLKVRWKWTVVVWIWESGECLYATQLRKLSLCRAQRGGR